MKTLNLKSSYRPWLQIFKFLPPLFLVLVKATIILSVVKLLVSGWTSYSYPAFSLLTGFCWLYFLHHSWLSLLSQSSLAMTSGMASFSFPASSLTNSYTLHDTANNKSCDVSSLIKFFSMTLLCLKIKFEDHSIAHQTLHDLCLLSILIQHCPTLYTLAIPNSMLFSFILFQAGGGGRCFLFPLHKMPSHLILVLKK